MSYKGHPGKRERFVLDPEDLKPITLDETPEDIVYVPTTFDELEDVLAVLGAGFRGAVTRDDFLPQNKVQCECGDFYPKVLGQYLTKEECLLCFVETEYGILVPRNIIPAVPLTLTSRIYQALREQHLPPDDIIVDSDILAALEHGIGGQTHTDYPFTETCIKAMEGDRHH